MTLQQLKQQFHSTLNEIYPLEEIDSFYFILVEHYLKLKRIDIALNPQTEIEFLQFKSDLEKFKSEIPIQYIIGETEFFGLQFKVNQHTLIPRPETEELIDWIIKESNTINQQLSTINILDIGTGSGCIPISLAKNIQNTSVSSIDISSEALKIAKENARINKVDIHFIEQDVLALESLNNAIASMAKQSDSENENISVTELSRNDEMKFDIIVSNPPYVRELEKKEIKNNVLNHEPHLALFVEDMNPLIFYNKIADLAIESLSKKGVLYFEINQYLGKETVDLLKSKGFSKIELRKDINGNDRMIKASK